METGVADKVDSLERQIEKQEARLQCLDDEAWALRSCLADLEVLRPATFDAKVHRLRFAQAHALHPLHSTAGGTACLAAGLLQVLRAGDLTASIALRSGAPSLAPLAAVCRQAEEAAREALPRIAVTCPRYLHVCGGITVGQRRLDSAERFDPCGEGSWSWLPAMAGRRSGASGARVAGGLMVCGGKSDSTAAVKDAELFDPARGTWEVLPEMPGRRSHAAAAVVAGYLYVCGGWDGMQYLASCVRFSPREGVWEAVAPMLERRSHAVAAAIGGRLLVCGGKGEGSMRYHEVECLVPGAATWQQLPPMLERRSQGAGIVVGGSLFICGGFDGVQHLSSSECLGPGAKAWRSMGPMRQARSSAVATALGGRVYVCGGLNGGQILKSVECFDMATGVWTESPPMLSARAHAAATTLWSSRQTHESDGQEGRMAESTNSSA